MGRNEFVLLALGLVIVAVVVVMPREQPAATPVVVTGGGGGGGGLGGFGDLLSTGAKGLSSLGEGIFGGF